MNTKKLTSFSAAAALTLSMSGAALAPVIAVEPAVVSTAAGASVGNGQVQLSSTWNQGEALSIAGTNFLNANGQPVEVVIAFAGPNGIVTVNGQQAYSVTADASGAFVVSVPWDDALTDQVSVSVYVGPSDLSIAPVIVGQVSIVKATPTEQPSEQPTEAPTTAPTEQPTEAPSEAPSEQPSEQPTAAPSEQPTEAPSQSPSATAEASTSASTSAPAADADVATRLDTAEEKQESAENGESTRFANCTEVREAGLAPIRSDHPDFRKKFDRDNDGIGCESDSDWGRSSSSTSSSTGGSSSTTSNSSGSLAKTGANGVASAAGLGLLALGAGAAVIVRARRQS